MAVIETAYRPERPANNAERGGRQRRTGWKGRGVEGADDSGAHPANDAGCTPYAVSPT